MQAVQILNLRILVIPNTELEDYAALDTTKEIHQAPGEVALVKVLIEKHATDYKVYATLCCLRRTW